MPIIYIHVLYSIEYDMQNTDHWQKVSTVALSQSSNQQQQQNNKQIREYNYTGFALTPLTNSLKH